jgi:phage shock protein PspC (stress-responsive transcriptional regulator)
MLSGVCNGLAAFLNVDVTVVRLLFVIITFATFGAWILAYVIMALFIPYADTPEDRAAAYGLRLKAQEFLDQANLHQARARSEWRRHWKRQQRAWRRGWHERWERKWDRRWQEQMAQVQAATAASAPPMPVFGHVLTAASLPVFAVINASVFVAWILVILSAVTTRTIFGWALPPEMPLWAALLVLFAIYVAVVGPLSAARHGARSAWGPYYAPWAAISGLLWVGFTMLFFWLSYQHIPQVHALIDELPWLFHTRQMSLALLDL